MATGKFRVLPGHTIMTRKGDLRRPGQEIEISEMGEAHKEMLRDNKIVQIEGREIKVEPTLEKRKPELTQATITLDGNVVAKPMQTSTVEEKVNAPAPVLTGIWTCPVETIKDKSLEELNAMIIERDGKIPAFDDKAEAIAWLSQDVK